MYRYAERVGILGNLKIKAWIVNKHYGIRTAFGDGFLCRGEIPQHFRKVACHIYEPHVSHTAIMYQRLTSGGSSHLITAEKHHLGIGLHIPQLTYNLCCMKVAGCLSG